MHSSIAIPWSLAVYLIGDLIVVAFWSVYLIFVKLGELQWQDSRTARYWRRDRLRRHYCRCECDDRLFGHNSPGTLTVSDGIHAASIALLGNYSLANLTASSDGHVG
jgi:hypothetical protein